MSKFRRWLSHFWEKHEEELETAVHPKLRVTLAFGRYELNGTRVNHAFGLLDKVFREAFDYLKLEKRGDLKVLLLGLGVGNVLRIFQDYEEKYGRKYEVTGVELDPEVIRLGEKYFELQAYKNLKVEIRDAAEFVRKDVETYDLVIVDLFVEDQVPPAICTPESLQNLKNHVANGGMLLFNRLMLTPELVIQTEDFFQKFQQTFSEAWHFPAGGNRMLVWERRAKGKSE